MTQTYRQAGLNVRVGEDEYRQTIAYDLRTKPWQVDPKFRQPADVPTKIP